MSTNKREIIVISEDDANRQIANGFKVYEKVKFRNIYVFPESVIGKGGWEKVIKWFFDTQISGMYSNPNRVAIFVVDFDKKKGYEDDKEYHKECVKRKTPIDLENRIFVLGSLDEPEEIVKGLKGTKKERWNTLGENLAKDCDKDTNDFWQHKQLRHNLPELKRMRSIVKPIIFGE